MGYLFLLFIPIFWLLLIRPQQQQRRTHMQVVASLEPGQRVMTVGGLIGTLTEVDDETVVIDVGDGTELTYGRTFIRQLVDDDVAADESDDDEEADEDEGPDEIVDFDDDEPHDADDPAEADR